MSALADASFDLIVSNPPYVPGRDRASIQAKSAITSHHWRSSAVNDGLGIYRRLIPEAARLLRPGGWLMMELGDSVAVREMCAAWTGIEIVNDLAGIPRVLIAQKP